MTQRTCLVARKATAATTPLSELQTTWNASRLPDVVAAEWPVSRSDLRWALCFVAVAEEAGDEVGR